jgi:ATP-dependent DNA helicase RecG
VLRMPRFRGTDKREFIDNRQVYGNAFDLLSRAKTVLRDHLPIAGRILPNVFERQDDPLYPPAALREALANALCHRDYGIGGGGVYLAIYDDRLEITSVGGLPFGLTVEELLRPHTSRLWNPPIAGVFYRRGIVEAWGSGTLKMAELNQAAGLQPPEFESGRGEVTVRFWPTRIADPTRSDRDLSPLQRELLALPAEFGPASLSQLSARLQTPTPRRTIQDNLALLRRLALVESEGQKRGTRWALSKDR